jgi:hypothetical protein
VKVLFIILPASLLITVAAAQEKQTGFPLHEQQFENQAERQEGITEDDRQWQQLDYYQKHPLNLNTADEDALKELNLLSDLQIINLLRYRKMLGPLVSFYELQAIPAWDVITIRQLLPYIIVKDQKSNIENVTGRLTGGVHTWLLRFARTISNSDDYNKTTANYLGNPSGVMLRYKYNYKNLLQYGITGDKDPGEQFFKGAQRTGFDFYSFHLFARKLGIIQSLAIGDFTVRFGQGLIQWQGLAFKKSADVLHAKRQGPALQPYNSAGEYNFHRGIGVTLKRKNVECTLFGSLRKLSANLVIDSFLFNETYVSSIQTSGYHRSLSEINDRNNVQCFTTGGALKYTNYKGHVGLNAVYYSLSKPLQPAEAPYDQYAISGSRWSNYSVDYSYTLRNIHVFGELAADQLYNTAMVHGLLASVDPKVDVAMVYRNISSKYQSLFSNAFTENSLPVNENGWYAGISIRPLYGWRLDVYADIFNFPWLKFQANAPSHGHEYLVQLNYMPNKHVEIYSRFRHETKAANLAGGNAPIQPLIDVRRQNWRTQISYRLNTAVTLRSRVETVWYANNLPLQKETGFLFFTDVHFKPAFKPFSLNGRVQYVETGGYNSRIYAWENSVLYNFSIPAFFDKALRYVLNVNYRLMNRSSVQHHKKFNCLLSLSFAQSVYPFKSTVRATDKAIESAAWSDIRLQIIFTTK